MSKVTFKGTPITIADRFPNIGDKVSNFVLVTNELKDVSLDSFSEERIVLNIFPSIDTPVCSDSVRHFNEAAAGMSNTRVLCISKDLPFAQARFCGAENIQNAITLSAFRNHDFARDYGVDITDGLIQGLLARSIIVLDAARKVIYTELVPEITSKPNYAQCLEALQG